MVPTRVRRMPEDHFGERGAERCDVSVGDMFDPTVVEIAVSFLAECLVEPVAVLGAASVAQRSVEVGADRGRPARRSADQ